MDLQEPNFPDSRDPIFSDSRDPVISFSGSGDPIFNPRNQNRLLKAP